MAIDREFATNFSPRTISIGGPINTVKYLALRMKRTFLIYSSLGKTYFTQEYYFNLAQQEMIDYLSDFSGKSEYHSTFRMKNKDGIYSWFQSEGKALRDETGFPIRVAGKLPQYSRAKDERANGK